jgi:hypothetical protein
MRRFDPVRFLAWLVLFALAGFIAIVLIGAMLPDERASDQAYAERSCADRSGTERYICVMETMESM